MTSSSSRTIPALDGFRVACIFIVACFHMWQQSWFTPHIGSFSFDPILRAGYLPVDATVLLSAFLLFLPYAEHRFDHSMPLPEPRDFYLRRLNRILPSYNIAMILTLVCYTLPFGIYPSIFHFLLDLLSHFSMTFTFMQSTYLGGSMPTTAWTVVIEMQMYLLFPFVARLCLKKPAATILSMTGAAFLFRLLMIYTRKEFGMVVNQLPSFLDVWAMGMLAAYAYVYIRDEIAAKFRYTSPIATIMFAISLYAVYKIFRLQAYNPPTGALQAGQMAVRFPFAVASAALMLSLIFSAKPLRFLFGNPVTRYLSSISINFYLTHQLVMLVIKRLDIIPHAAQNPAAAFELPWQLPYIISSFLISLALSAIITAIARRIPKIKCLPSFDMRDI